jgi:hypothetical protein
MSREAGPASSDGAALTTVPLIFSDFYSPEHDTIFCGHDAGFFSICTVSLWSLAELQRVRGIFPRRIDYSRNFLSFRNAEQLRRKTDLYPLFFKPWPDSSIDPRRRLPYADQHGIYAFLDYKRLTPIIDRFFRPSDRAVEVRAELKRRYAIDPSKTIAVVYRGTDKGVEVEIASPQAFLSKTRQLAVEHPGHRVWIQTDERDVRAMFVREFGDRCFYLNEMPVSGNGVVVHGQDDDTLNMDRSDFGVLLVAVNSLLAQADIVVNHTGNMALWLCLWRGHARGVWQFDDEARCVNPAAPACYWAALRRFMIKATSWRFLRPRLLKITSWSVWRRRLVKIFRSMR